MMGALQDAYLDCATRQCVTYSRNPTRATASVVGPVAQPMPNMHVPKGTHSQAMGGVKLWYPQASSEATAKLLLCLWALHHDDQLLTCYHVHTHTPRRQPCSPCWHPTARSNLLGLVHDHRMITSNTSHTGAPQQQSAHTTQPSHKYVRKSALQQKSQPMRLSCPRRVQRTTREGPSDQNVCTQGA
jgi:hypothetical protein